MNIRMPHEVRRVSGPTRWTSVTDYAITSLTAVQADLVLLAAPTTASCTYRLYGGTKVAGVLDSRPS